MSEDFIHDIIGELELQDPVCAVINITQAKTSNIADLWLDLKIPLHLTKDEHDPYVKRKNMVLSDIALAGFYIDPFKDKSKLSTDQRSRARTFISSKLNGNFKNELLTYESGQTLHPDIMSKISRAIDFWTFAENGLPNLNKIALKLLSIPASTAQLERVFSMWQYLHTKVRNRLSFERSQKLMHIYYYFNNLDGNTWEWEVDNFIE